MKRILTLLMMFLVCGNLLFAQSEGTTPDEGTTATVTVQPKLNFQAVVRDGNNQLVYSTNVATVITITYDGGTYTENHPSVFTNQNGLLNLVIGDGEDVEGDLYDVDWATATIKADITYSAPVIKEDGSTETQDFTITVETPVTAVPYALQAGPARLTTPMIVEYINGMKLGTNEGTDPNHKDDVLSILDAIRNNPNHLKADLKDTIVKYMKTQMDVARQIFRYYLDHVDSADVWDTYTKLMENPVAKEAVRDVIIHFIKTHKDDAMEVLEYYAEHVTTADLHDLFTLFDNNDALKEAIRAVIATELEGYLTANNYVSADACSGVDICALANQGMTTCPTEADFVGTTTSTVDAGQVTLTTAINNPNHYNFAVKYTYELGGTTFELETTKEGSNVTALIGSLPAGTQVKLSIQFFGHNECDLNPVVYTF